MTARSRLLAAAAACLAAATGVHLLAVRTTRGQMVDNVAMELRPAETWWAHNPTAERFGAMATVLAVGVAVAGALVLGVLVLTRPATRVA